MMTPTMLKRWRERNRLTQAQAAEIFGGAGEGFSTRTVKRMELHSQITRTDNRKTIPPAIEACCWAVDHGWRPFPG